MGHSPPNIYAGQEDKDKGLYSCRKDGYCHEWEGEEEGNDGSNNHDEQFFSKYISEKTNRKRDRTGEMADDFYGQKKRCYNGNRAHEVFKILEYTLGPDSLPVVVEKDNKSTAQGHVEFARRGHKPGNKAEEVTN